MRGGGIGLPQKATGKRKGEQGGVTLKGTKRNVRAVCGVRRFFDCNIKKRAKP